MNFMEVLDYPFWGNTVKSWLIAGGLVVGGWIVATIVAKGLRSLVIKRAKKTGTRLDDVLAEVGSRPIYWVILLAGFHAAVGTLTMPEWISNLLWTLLVVAWSVVGAVFLVRLLNGIMVNYLQRYAEESEQDLFGQLVRMLRSAVGAVVWVIAGLFIVSNLGFNVSSLLAGLGLGGLALAMASKDTLSNIFGSITILVNGPFQVGETIKYQGHAGTVEAIGLRDTRIRLFDGNLVFVPNSLAPTSVIENISRRPSFRVLFKIGFTYDTTMQQVENAVTLIQDAVRQEKGTGEKTLVHFVGFGESALEIQVIYYIEDSDRILDAQHGVNRKIVESLEAAGISLAYRTVTVKQG